MLVPKKINYNNANAFICFEYKEWQQNGPLL